MCYESKAEAMYVRRARLFLDSGIRFTNQLFQVHLEFPLNRIIEVYERLNPELHPEQWLIKMSSGILLSTDLLVMVRTNRYVLFIEYF
jgi:hypothetical protein